MKIKNIIFRFLPKYNSNCLLPKCISKNIPQIGLNSSVIKDDIIIYAIFETEEYRILIAEYDGVDVCYCNLHKRNNPKSSVWGTFSLKNLIEKENPMRIIEFKPKKFADIKTW